MENKWLDGLYMASPFLAEFAKVFEEPELFNDVTKQLILMEKHARDEKSGLLYHGWEKQAAEVGRSEDWTLFSFLGQKHGMVLNGPGRCIGFPASRSSETTEYHCKPELIIICCHQSSG